MRIGRILAIGVVSLASLIVIGTAVIAVRVLAPSRNETQQNFAPPEGQQSISKVGGMSLSSQSSGNSSFLYRASAPGGAKARLTSVSSGIESEASFSHDGKLVVYAYARAADSKSSIWVVGSDGKNARAMTAMDEDALHPVFSPDDSKVFYATSSFTGNHSPIARPARHDWDVLSIPIQAGAAVVGATPLKITHQSLYDLRSLDVAPDGINPGGIKLLVSTSGYPIGELIKEFNLGAEGRDKIFQPHVPGESSVGPAFGEARFVHDGMDILFLAATDTSGGNYDYNVFSMSDTTGGELKQLTHLKGMTTDLRVLPNSNATFVNGSRTYSLDVAAQTVRPI